MKLHLTNSHELSLITSIEEGAVRVNDNWHHQNILLLPNQLVRPWNVESITHIQNQDWQEYLFFDTSISVDLLIIGTGRQQIFLLSQQIISLLQNGIGVECMHSRAACNTYNVLVSEGRRVALALIVE